MTDKNRKESQALLYKAWLRYTLYCGAVGAVAGGIADAVGGPPGDGFAFFLFYTISGESWWRFYCALQVFHLDSYVDAAYGSIFYSTIRLIVVAMGHALVGLVVGFVFSPLYMSFRMSLSKSYREKFQTS